MNEWGIPNWLDPFTYGETINWTRNRWRWEFLRRRDDVRSAFDDEAENSYCYWSKFAGKEGFPVAHLRPDQPGFTAMHPLARSLGLPRLPNPRIGEQPFDVIGFSDWAEGVAQFYSEEPPEGFERVDFDLSKPLEPQLECAKQLLKEMQRTAHGKAIQKRRHPTKWLTYLRILDGREAGASWAELTGLLPSRNGTEQAARDAWQQADALRFNF
ncbi:hypothetical protein RA2_03690 [Roseovarius sp. A-2]|uniref:DUF2285 domain-containing protein n=1 Tax=Roseovarius sp. A-2 TaxID=1570360 RepID=UPI0009C6AFE9|nr:DUF2285 domain-containing protein [Roseovarius sp. A-2]GAW36617.1 hypothetical protein RA2_03690 [Roseovarius sp. A-2]